MHPYYQPLTLPVEFIPWKPTGIEDFNISYEFVVPLYMINKEIHRWLHSIGLRIFSVRYFHSTPENFYCLHKDSSKPIDNQYVRLNWVYDGEGSKMIWYELLPSKQIAIWKNIHGEEIQRSNLTDCKEVCSAELSGPNLVNVGYIHSMKCGSVKRHCYATYLTDISSSKRLEWNDAMDRFKDYYR